jgi:hypothetical protein
MPFDYVPAHDIMPATRNMMPAPAMSRRRRLTYSQLRPKERTECLRFGMKAWTNTPSIAVPLILARFPDWEPFAKLSPRPDGAGNVIDFNIPCPFPAAEAGFLVSTADEELTVGFHTHHGHFTDYEDRTDRTQIDAGLDYAAAIVEDRIGVLSYYTRGKFSGSRSVDLPPPETLPKLYEGMGLVGTLEGLFRDWERVTLRSWSGRFDRDEVRG